MMTERQLIERFLKLQEHPELMDDEQLQQALDDPEMRELVEQVALVKRTFKMKSCKSGCVTSMRSGGSSPSNTLMKETP